VPKIDRPDHLPEVLTASLGEHVAGDKSFHLCYTKEQLTRLFHDLNRVLGLVEVESFEGQQLDASDEQAVNRLSLLVALLSARVVGVEQEAGNA